MSEIRAIGDRTTNAQLMADCQQLGYLEGVVLDATFGEGRFWRNVIHDWKIDLRTNDIDPTNELVDTHHDFRHLPWPDSEFDTVVFDPPYKLNGTSTGKGPSALDDGYGVGGQYANVADKMRLIYDGAIECARVSSQFLLVKCQDQVVSGSVVWQTQLLHQLLGRPEHRMHLVDMLHVQGYRKQPEGRRQLHARRDYSTLLVFEKR